MSLFVHPNEAALWAILDLRLSRRLRNRRVRRLRQEIRAQKRRWAGAHDWAWWSGCARDAFYGTEPAGWQP